MGNEVCKDEMSWTDVQQQTVSSNNAEKGTQEGEVVVMMYRQADIPGISAENI